ARPRCATRTTPTRSTSWSCSTARRAPATGNRTHGASPGWRLPGRRWGASSTVRRSSSTSASSRRPPSRSERERERGIQPRRRGTGHATETDQHGGGVVELARQRVFSERLERLPRPVGPARLVVEGQVELVYRELDDPGGQEVAGEHALALELHHTSRHR